MQRTELVNRLKSVIQVNGHMLAVAIGNGMSAQYVINGGADLILAISAGRFRQMGQNAFSGFFGCTNTNQMVLDFATKEILPVTDDFPVIAGVFMQDPCIYLYEFLQNIMHNDFNGVINYPSVGFFSGHFRNALEEMGMGFEKEVEGIRLAHFLGLFTVAYVFDEQQAIQMATAGADIICVHFGITGGGSLGADRFMSLEMAMEIAQNIFQKLNQIRPDIIKIVSGGPVQTPIDAHSFYQNTLCQGFLGGSPIERLPVERAMVNTVRAFKSAGDFDHRNIVSQVLNGNQQNLDYADFMLEYIRKNYSKCIRLKDLAVVTHLSTTRLSVVFKEKTGKSFTRYLIDFRIEKAKELLQTTDYQIKEIALQCGYDDYPQFTKIFKKNTCFTPQEYRAFMNKC